MRKGPRTALSVLWALIPFCTIGLGTFAAFLYPAITRRRRWAWLSVAGYLTALVGELVLVGPDNVSGWRDALLTVLLFGSWLGGTVHAFGVRSAAFPGVGSPPPPRIIGAPESFQDAIAVAEDRRRIRHEARELAARDAPMAWELRIGRPDLPRRYDDGGLIDVNHAPPEVLAMLPNMSPDLVQRIVAARDECGGFISAEELSAVAQLPPRLTAQIAEYAVFVE